jgi:hypothetical protein
MRSSVWVVALPAAALLAAALVHERPRNPSVDRDHSMEAALKVPPRVQDVLRRACYDCHSSETRWPWYSAVTPMSGFLERDVRRAREVMNFSEWTITAGASPARSAATLNAVCAAVQSGLMPKKRYKLLHPEAQLSRSDVEAVCQWTHSKAAELAESVRKRHQRDELTRNLRQVNNRNGFSSVK